VHPAPSDAKTSLPNLSQDLLDAIGAVGRREPRAAGDRHLLRALVHLIHGPVRNVIVDDAQLLAVDALDALHEAALIGRAQLWLIFDAAQRPPRGPTVHPDPRTWMTDVCTIATPGRLLRVWQQRESHETCQLPPPGWWHRGPAAAQATAAGYAGSCTNPGAHPGARQQVECLLGLARRSLTAGHTTATHVRRRIEDLLTHPATTADHAWALTAVDREAWTAGMDALGQTHPRAQHARLADVTSDGAAIRVTDGPQLEPFWTPVHPRHRDAVARLRTSRRLAGCTAGELLDGVFDEDPGIRGQRARQGGHSETGA
jgi:hypothetical protein